ncbi:MAG: hypothetical protein HY701_07125 [Gemmatimonadetes bacterium]|nr:hypothetical protein [Gemmatimonadota bacterium]
MRTHLQESGGLRWTAPVQSPVPVGVAATLSGPVRAVLAACLVLLALGQVLAATGRRPVAGTPVSNPAQSPTPAAAF